MTKDEALKMCLEYIETNANGSKFAILIKEALAQPEQKPVAWMVWGENNVPSLTFTKPSDKYVFDSLYMTPPQRKPLTEQKIGAILEDTNAFGTRLYTFARAIEAAHGIKGEA